MREYKTREGKIGNQITFTMFMSDQVNCMDYHKMITSLINNQNGEEEPFEEFSKLVTI